MNKDVCVNECVCNPGCHGSCRLRYSPTNADGSPYWTTHTPKSTRTVHYEVGSAKQSTPQLSQLRAESAAKDAIGRWASTNVDNALVTFIEEAGEVLRTKQMLEVLQNLSIQTVNIGLRGVTCQRYTAAHGTSSGALLSTKTSRMPRAASCGVRRKWLAQAQAEAQARRPKPCLLSWKRNSIGIEE